MPRYSEQSQKLILNVTEFFDEEKRRISRGEEFVSPTNVLFRAHLALKVSERTISNIKRTGVRSDKEYIENMSHKMKIKKTKVNEVIKNSIRETIYRMCEKKEYVTMATLHQKLRDELSEDFPYCINSVRTWCKSIGFRWRKEDNRYYLMESPTIQMKRLRFLREFMRNQESEHPLRPVFLDETWIFSKGSFRKSWQDGTLATCSSKTGEGYRYIILHAGGMDGFIPNASLVFKSGSQTGDYHSSMNRVNFENWFKTQLIPNLKQKSLIIMDNASYHSGLAEEMPTKSWPKYKLIDWLKNNNHDFPEYAMKDEIWSIVAAKKPLTKTYYLDEYVKPFGHTILRLPPYHCHFNAIEMVWSQCKRKYDKLISSSNSKPEEIINAWNLALQDVSIDQWQNYVEHVLKVIGDAWKVMKVCDASDMEPIIININNDSDSSTDTEDFSDFSDL